VAGGNQGGHPQRTSREGETLIKRIVSYVATGSSTASRLSDSRNTGDFRLLDGGSSGDRQLAREPRLLRGD